MQCDVSHLVLWIKLLKTHFEDLLYAPISVCDVGSAATIEESPFLAVSVDRDMVQNLCTQHLRRQTIFLFLHCCFKLVHFHHEADHQFSCGGKYSSIISTLQVCSEHFTCLGLVELFEWLQKCASLENVVDYESFRKSCFGFGSSFLQFYMEEVCFAFMYQSFSSLSHRSRRFVLLLIVFFEHLHVSFPSYLSSTSRVG